MLKKLLMLCVAVVLSLSAGFASAVEVNTADQAALESVKGIGPVHAKAIIDERTKNGPFKDADDLANRVKGLGTKSVANLEQNGLTVGGSSLPPTGKKPAAAGTTANSPGGSAATNSTVKSSTAATAATSPAATTSQTPAATPAATPASGTKASKKSKKDSAAASAAASASSPSAASDAKSSKSKHSKKDKAASAAAASQ